MIRRNLDRWISRLKHLHPQVELDMEYVETQWEKKILKACEHMILRLNAEADRLREEYRKTFGR